LFSIKKRARYSAGAWTRLGAMRSGIGAEFGFLFISLHAQRNEPKKGPFSEGIFNGYAH
jgi:hypothetical protein